MIPFLPLPCIFVYPPIPVQNPLPGWLVGGNQGGQCGRGEARVAPGGFSHNRGRGVVRGKPAQWRGGPGDRWAPY